MKIQTWIVGIAVVTLSGMPASAQSDAIAWTIDQNVTPVACDDCCDGCDGCDCGAGVGGGLCGFTLAGLLGMDDSPITIGGWTQIGYHDRNTPLSVARNDLLAFNDLPSQVNLHQQYLYLGKEADGSKGFDIGGRVDFLYGTDAQKTQAFGNPGAQFRDQGTFDASLDHGDYGFAIPQLYGEVAIGDLSVIVGHFYTIVGYEVVTAPDNFFYSHSLTMFNSEPFTHTGVLTTYSGFDNITLYNGWTLGWDTGFDNANGGTSYLGGVGIELTDALTFTYITTYGNFGLRDNGNDDSYSHSCVLTAGLTDNLQYVLQSDYLRIDNPGGGILQDQVGINQYLFFSLTDIVSLGGRMEWWKNDGTSNYAATGGMNVRLGESLIWRPEYRKAWSPGGGYDDEIFGMDMILTY